MRLFTRLACCLALATGSCVAQSFQLFLDAGSLPDGVVSTSPCGEALQQSIACNETLLFASSAGTFLDSTSAETLCVASCLSSLEMYRSGISNSCAGVIIQGDDITYPATFAADQMIYSYNSSCLRDASTGSWCSPYFESLANSTTTVDSSMSALPASVACSSCTIQMGLLSQESAFGYASDIVEDWPSIQQLCGINYNLSVPSQAYLNVSIPTTPAPICLSGNTYTVKSGDTCTAISLSQSVGTGDIISLNGLLLTCTNIEVGQSLCLPQTCQLYEVQSGDTCLSIIAQSSGLSLTQFYAWNPTINPYCTNLIAGAYLCLSPPGGGYTYTLPATTVAPTGTAITTTTPAPAPTAVGTIPNCGKWYVVESGDYCNKILLNQTITLSDFLAYNPEVNTNCTNLFLASPGYAYCVYAVAQAALPTTYAAVPTNAASGSDVDCYTWYTVVSGDTCTTVTNNEGITIAQFLSWNPELNAQCTNLALGEAYCVLAQPVTTGTTGTTLSGPTATSTYTTTATTTTAATVPTPTNAAPGAVANCKEWYTAQSGDYCYEICQNEGCTVANLQTWNPSLGSSCVVQIDVAYCVSA